MKKEEDIYKLFNEMDELIDSVNLDNKKEKKVNNNNDFNIPDMSKVILENDKKVVFYEEKNESPKLIDINIDEQIIKEKDIVNENITKEQEIEPLENKQKKLRKKKKDKKKSKKWVITFSILDILAIICLFLMYGPISYFRNLWVTSAMTTMTHKYLAYVFFNQEQIDKIMANNIVIEVDDNTNIEEIQIQEVEEQITYSSPEEEQILKKDQGNDLYKVIDIEGNGYKGHLLVVYDPSKIELAQIPNKKYGWTLDQFIAKKNAVAGINAGGFNYSESYGYSPTGVFIIDGQVINDGGSTGWGGGIIGFTNDNVLILTKTSAYEAVQMGVRDAVSFGPFLIVNGVASQFKGNGGYGIAPRTAIGQRKDGIVLMLVIDGRRPGHSLGVDMVELTNIMLKYGAYNAANLDGGGSSTIAVGTEILSVAGGSGYSGDRYLPNAWLVMP